MLDVSNDFEDVCCVDFATTATLRIGEVDLNLTKVLEEPHTLKELDPAGGQVERHGKLFAWAKKRTSMPPLGSIVIDADGVYWTTWKVILTPNFDSWAILGLNLNIVTAAANTATVLKGEYIKGRANEAKAVWKGIVSGVVEGTAADVVTARFQQSEETARLEFGAESSMEAYRVYFESPGIPEDLAGGEYRLVDSEGYRYRVHRYFREGRIDTLPVAITSRVTEGKEFFHR